MKRFGMEYFTAVAMCAIMIFVMSSSAAAGIIYVKWNSPGSGAPPVYDGKSWATAFHKVQDGVNASVSGDEVWVAAGTYDGRATLKSGVALYGGFGGSETSRAERDWHAHPTIVQDYGTGYIFTVPANATAQTRIDGFVITSNAAAYVSACRGISCQTGSAPVIAHNVLRNLYSGISASGGSTTIVNNLVFNNGYGGGIGCGSGGRVVGNTVAYNRGPGISTGSALVANNIVAFNKSGIGGYPAPVIRNNCVFGNTEYDYSPWYPMPSPSDCNISADPKFASTDYPDLHLQPDSPCIGAGDDSVLEAAWTDIDGQPRLQGAHVDIGADESDGTRREPRPGRILRVTSTGNDANDGSAWDDAHAMKTIQSAVNAAFGFSGEVWVAAGEYRGGSTPSTFRMRDGVALYGGFAGNETSRDQRNCSANRTILPDGYVEIAGCTSPATRVDGLFLQGSGAQSSEPIMRAVDSASTISNNTITGYYGFQYAILATGATSDRIVANTMTGNTGSYMIRTEYSPSDPLPPATAPESTAIIGNRIVGNSASGILVRLIHNCGHVIADNVIGDNEREGMYLECHRLVITNNLVFGNGKAGVRFSSSTSAGEALMANNTIVGNGLNPAGSTYVQGINVSWPTNLRATNNTIAFNAVGIRRYAAPVTLYNNNVFGNVNGNYVGFTTDPTGTSGNISLDPLFRNAASGDYHLLWNSPCVDAGTNNGAPPTDLDGNPRPIDGNIDGLAVTDIGAYEFVPMRVVVDVLPGESTNIIQLQPNRMITVAILGTPEFDVRSVNPMSVLFGPGKAMEAHGRGHWEDANGDGRIDLVLHFRCEQAGIQPGDTAVSLSGRLVSGAPFTGSDTIVAIGSKSKGK